MGERVSDQTTVAAPAATVWAVINDLEAYPEWADGVEEVVVEERDGDGQPVRARFTVDAKILRVTYTLGYRRDGDVLAWELIEGDQLSQLDGEYRVTPEGETTRVEYMLEVDLNLPLPGMIKRQGAKRILDEGLRGMKARAESLA